MQTTHTDIIIAGGGLAGLTLALECSKHAFFDKKNIIILDRDDKSTNDRTWCFWAADSESIPPVIHHSWDKCHFFGTNFEAGLNIVPYRYHMIRGIDFYHWAKATIGKKANIKWVKADIESIDAANGVVNTAAGTFVADWVFNSAFRGEIDSPDMNPGFTKLLQHFKGWRIQTTASAFDPSTMTFMDYRVEQQGETRFVYVLPFSETRALVEFTVFSPALLEPEEYDGALRGYLSDFLNIQDFKIEEQEFGVIPMTDFPFPARQEGSVVHIGTAGGFVKASSGYAFKRTQRKVLAFVDAWERTGRPDARVFQSPRIFRVFDSIFLRVLHDRNGLGSIIFKNLFQKLPPTLVLRFLDEDSSPFENLRLVSAPPAGPFLRALFKKLIASCAAFFTKHANKST